jgi:nucleotidyltransferase/DNA polymerase involved in DNA repair
MRIACIRVPSFAVSVERQRNSALAGPLVVLDRGAVLDSSDDLNAYPGLRARQAKALYPGAVFVEADHALYRNVSSAMLDALEGVTPCVESSTLGIAFADASGLDGHYEDEFALAATLLNAVQNATGLSASAGVAGNKFVAWVAAALSPAGDAGIVPSGREQEFLQHESVDLLPFNDEVTERLRLLALRTLGDIAALPGPAVEAQFGSRTGGRLWELANGIDREPLRPRKPQELINERMSFDVPVVATEALLAAGKQIVAHLTRRLKGRTARRMHLQLLADERIVWERMETFREPAGDDRTMLLLMRTRFALLELPKPVDTVSITLSGLGREVAKQAKLFTDTQQNLNQIGEAIRQLRARYGRDMVGRVLEVDPWSRHPEERAVLMPYDA